MPADDPDRVTPVRAAELLRLGYPEAFNALRWGLEEAFDPATNETIPMPPDLAAVPYLTSSQEKRLGVELAGYRAAKTRRIEWARRRWMRVPAWGGRRAPGGEYRYSAARCDAWFARSLGG